MLPFCGYNMADYFAHWLSMAGRADPSKLPKLFAVNWFRRGATGRFLWPGYGENCRVLKWICERVEGTGRAVDTAIGRVPTPDALDLRGLHVGEEALRELLSIDVAGWRKEAEAIAGHYSKFGERLPAALWRQLEALRERLGKA
jgi:phosphoenolpyruvate carboxykinase (GTP)